MRLHCSNRSTVAGIVSERNIAQTIDMRMLLKLRPRFREVRSVMSAPAFFARKSASRD